MNINDRTYSRILYIIVWIPLILIPVAYLLPPLKGSNYPLPHLCPQLLMTIPGRTVPIRYCST